MACEVAGRWPDAVEELAIIVSLPKPEGGFRPIGLLPTLSRIWSSARRAVAREWERVNERAYSYVGEAKVLRLLPSTLQHLWWSTGKPCLNLLRPLSESRTTSLYGRPPPLDAMAHPARGCDVPNAEDEQSRQRSFQHCRHGAWHYCRIWISHY